MSPAYTALMYSRLDEEPAADDSPENVIRASSGEVLLDRNVIETYRKLCAKPSKGYPVLTEILKYFNNAVNDKKVYLTDKGDLYGEDALKTAEGKYRYDYKLTDLMEQVLLSDIQKSLHTQKKKRTEVQ